MDKGANSRLARKMANELRTLSCQRCGGAAKFDMYPMPNLSCHGSYCQPVYYLDRAVVFTDEFFASIPVAFAADVRAPNSGEHSSFVRVDILDAMLLRSLARRYGTLPTYKENKWPYLLPPLPVRQQLCLQWNLYVLQDRTTETPQYRRIENRGRKHPSPTG